MGIKIKNWDEFQHYKDRNPPWIKLHRRLLNDRQFFSLDGECVKTLVLLWMLAAETQTGELPAIEDIAFRLRIDSCVLALQISKLNHWLIVDDSNLLADCTHDASDCVQDAPSETETETEIDTETKTDTEEEQLALLPTVPAVPKNKHDSMDTAQKAKNVFNAVFRRNVACTSMISVKVKERIKAEKLHPWQFELLPILVKAWRPDVEKTQNFSLGMILRDGKHRRTDANGRTTGGYNWLFEAYQIADTLVIDQRLLKIAEHFGLADKLELIGAKIEDCGNED
jgi:hypothetical protein